MSTKRQKIKIKQLLTNFGKMKNVVRYFVVAVIFMLVSVVKLQAETASSAVVDLQMAETSELVERIEHIHEMDKSDLTSSERKELRNEVREINKELRQRGPYIYISGSVLLIILILLLIL
jgi:hypothetical protein